MPYDHGRQCDAVIALFRQAVERDPHFAFAHAMLAVFLWLKVVTSSAARRMRTSPNRSPTRSCAVDRPANPFIMSGADTAQRVRQRGARRSTLRSAPRPRRRRRAVRRAFRRKRPLGVSRAGSRRKSHRTHAGPRPVPERMLHTGMPPRTLGGSADVAQHSTTTYPNSFLAWTELANALAALDRWARRGRHATGQGHRPDVHARLLRKGTRSPGAIGKRSSTPAGGLAPA